MGQKVEDIHPKYLIVCQTLNVFTQHVVALLPMVTRYHYKESITLARVESE